MTAMTDIREICLYLFFLVLDFAYISVFKFRVMRRLKVASKHCLCVYIYWLLDEFCQSLYCLLEFMHKSSTCFQNSHKFWSLAVRFQKHGSLHAESIKKAVIYSGTVPSVSEPSISTLPKMFLQGGRPWHSFMDHWGLQPGTRSKSEVCFGTCPQPRSTWAELAPSCHFNTFPNSWCLQSSRQRHASNEHNSHSLVGTLNAVSSLSPSCACL